MNPASPRQISFLRTLADERGVTLDGTRNPAGLNVREASDLIEVLLGMPKPASQVSFVELELGMYRLANGDIYRVQRSRESGRLYAKKLDWANNTFVFESGAMRLLTADDRMTLDEAKAWGVETGICCVCSAFLTDPRSVEAGIGPVCARRV
jgi:hypothetical protein